MSLLVIVALLANSVNITGISISRLDSHLNEIAHVCMDIPLIFTKCPEYRIL